MFTTIDHDARNSISALTGKKTLVHRHPLFFVQRSKISHYWSCDFCNKTAHELQETCSYRCPNCNFDICRDCIQPKGHSSHVHDLEVADRQCIYRDGILICDVCGRESRFSRHCKKCEFDVCFACFKQDTQHKVTKLVAPNFSKGLLSLENFVQILESTSTDLTSQTANRLMPVLIGHVDNAHKAFDLAKHRIHEINDELNSDFEATVVREKTANDELLNTQDQLNGINQSIKTKQDEETQVQQLLSGEEKSFTDAESFLKKQEENLANAPSVGGSVLKGLLIFGAIGAAVGGAAAKSNIDNAKIRVDEASSRVSSTRRRLDDRNSELSMLRAELAAKENSQRETSENLKSIKHKKEQIKQLQKRLAKINVAIKSCTTFVDTTALRTKMMADEANGQLPDIQMMLGPLKAIAEDLGDASVSNNRLLSGGYNIRDIGTKIKMISAKAQKSITAGNFEEDF